MRGFFEKPLWILKGFKNKKKALKKAFLEIKQVINSVLSIYTFGINKVTQVLKFFFIKKALKKAFMIL
jgi:hypothetical protein